MAYGDANAIALEMGERQVLPITKEVPVVCSVNGTDPTRVMSVFLKKVIETGFSGVNNFPTMGMIDGNFRATLEATGMGYDKEVDMVGLAHSMDIFTMAYAFTVDEAVSMAKAGCDLLLAHVGLTSGGSIGAVKTLTLEESAELIGKMDTAVRKVNPEIMVLCHGGPISMPKDVEFILDRVKCEGFVGASSMERIPVESGIRDMTAAFAAIPYKK
jgi:predicted TIM-barrel enzyme